MSSDNKRTGHNEFKIDQELYLGQSLFIAPYLLVGGRGRGDYDGNLRASVLERKLAENNRFIVSIKMDTLGQRCN